MSGTTIRSVVAWDAYDSRGTPTVGCALRLTGGGEGSVIVPSGASTGRHEAHELRDGGRRLGGRGVRNAVKAVNQLLAPRIVGLDAADTDAIESAIRSLDDTAALIKIGGNASLAVSMAATLAAADAAHQPLYRYLLDGKMPILPMPMVNIVSGGAHASAAVDIQDVLVVPVGALTVSEAFEMVWEIRQATRSELGRRHPGLASSLVADEGGLAGQFRTNAEAIEIVLTGIEAAGFRPGHEASIALDVAATQLYDERTETYALNCDGQQLDAGGMIELVEGWFNAYPIVSIEDALAEDDWAGWAELTSRLGARVQLLGDDLLVTNSGRLERARDARVANAILVKPNQAGTYAAAAGTVRTAHSSSYRTVVSARSGDTEDCWLADLAVGWCAGQIKVGSMTRSERLSKYNRLLRIEAEEGTDAAFAGREALRVLR